MAGKRKRIRKPTEDVTSPALKTRCSHSEGTLGTSSKVFEVSSKTDRTISHRRVKSSISKSDHTTPIDSNPPLSTSPEFKLHNKPKRRTNRRDTTVVTNCVESGSSRLNTAFYPPELSEQSNNSKQSDQAEQKHAKRRRRDSSHRREAVEATEHESADQLPPAAAFGEPEAAVLSSYMLPTSPTNTNTTNNGASDQWFGPPADQNPIYIIPPAANPAAAAAAGGGLSDATSKLSASELQQLAANAAAAASAVNRAAFEAPYHPRTRNGLSEAVQRAPAPLDPDQLMCLPFARQANSPCLVAAATGVSYPGPSPSVQQLLSPVSVARLMSMSWRPPAAAGAEDARKPRRLLAESDWRRGQAARAHSPTQQPQPQHASGVNQRVMQLQHAQGDPAMQLAILQDINQLLLLGLEENLASLHVTGLVQCIVEILESQDDDRLVEVKTLSCNVLAHMVDAIPRSSEAVVPALPLLLTTMSCSFVGDILERIINLLEQISRRHGREVLACGGVSTVLGYYDFVTAAQHRTILNMVGNCFAELRTAADFDQIADCLPGLAARLRDSEPRCVERVCACFVRLVSAYRSQPQLLQRVVAGCQLFANLQHLLVASPPVLSGVRDVVHMLSVLCSACPDLTVDLIKQGIGGTLYCILTGHGLDTVTLRDRLLAPLSSSSSNTVTTTSTTPGRTRAHKPQRAWEPLMLVVPELTQLEDTPPIVQRSPQDLHAIVVLICELLAPVPSAYTTLLLCEPANDGVTPTEQPEQAVSNRHGHRRRRCCRISAVVGRRPSNSGCELSASVSCEECVRDPRASLLHADCEALHGWLHRATDGEQGSLDQLDSVQLVQALLPLLFELLIETTKSQTRLKCLEAIQRMIFHSSPLVLARAIEARSVCDHVVGMLNSPDPCVVLSALQIALMLLDRLPPTFAVQFRKQGILHQVSQLLNTHAPGTKTGARSRSRERAQQQQTDCEPPNPYPWASNAASVDGARTPTNQPAENYSLKADRAMSHWIGLACEQLDSRVHALLSAPAGRHSLDSDLMPQLQQVAAQLRSSKPALWVHALHQLIRLLHAHGPSPFELHQSGLTDALLSFLTRPDSRELRVWIVCRLFFGPRVNASTVGRYLPPAHTTMVCKKAAKTMPLLFAANPTLLNEMTANQLRDLDAFIDSQLPGLRAGSIDGTTAFGHLLGSVLAHFHRLEHFQVRGLPSMSAGRRSQELPSDEAVEEMSFSRPLRVGPMMPTPGLLWLELHRLPDLEEEAGKTRNERKTASPSSPSSNSSSSSSTLSIDSCVSIPSRLALSITALATLQNLERLLMQRNYIHALLSDGLWPQMSQGHNHSQPDHDYCYQHQRHQHPEADCHAPVEHSSGDASLHNSLMSTLRFDSAASPPAAGSQGVFQRGLRSLLQRGSEMIPSGRTEPEPRTLRRRQTTTTASRHEPTSKPRAVNYSLRHLNPRASTSSTAVDAEPTTNSSSSRHRRLKGASLLAAFGALSAAAQPRVVVEHKSPSSNSSSAASVSPDAFVQRAKYRMTAVFFIGQHQIPPDMPLYEAIRKFSPELGAALKERQVQGEQETEDLASHLMWNTVHTIQYRLAQPTVQPTSAQCAKKTGAHSTPSVFGHRHSTPSTSVGPPPPAASSSGFSAAITCLKRRRSEDGGTDGASAMLESPAAAELEHPLWSQLTSELPQGFLGEVRCACARAGHVCPGPAAPTSGLDATSESILSLLRVFHSVTRLWYTVRNVLDPYPLVSPLAFKSSKLCVKASRQLQDPFNILAGNLPNWLVQTISVCPFLFDFEIRRTFFYVYHFDRPRTLLRLQDNISTSPSELDVQQAAGDADPLIDELSVSSPTDSAASGSRVDSSAFGRLMHELGAAGRARHHTRLALVPNLRRHKVTVQRDGCALLRQAEVTLRDMADSRAMLEIAFDGEVGFGLGPTLEFYTLVSRQLMVASLGLWHGSETTDEGFILAPAPGLYPRPLPKQARSCVVREVRAKFTFLGRLLARTLLDWRQLDLPLSPAFFKWFMTSSSSSASSPVASGHILPSDLSLVDPVLARHIGHLTQLANRRHELSARLERPSGTRSAHHNTTTTTTTSSSRETEQTKSVLQAVDNEIEELCLNFVLPGYEIELLKNGSNLAVCGSNIADYVRLVSHWLVVEGASRQMEAVLEGFDSVLPGVRKRLSQLFQPEEMEGLFCGRTSSEFWHDAVDHLGKRGSIVSGLRTEAEFWQVQSLSEACQCDHGYTSQSRTVRNLFEVMSEFNEKERRLFVQFVTGSPRLPVGGFRSLKPPLKIVMKRENGENADNHLPSVMTCQNYLKLPDYSSKELLAEKLRYAIREGQNAFHLS